MLNKQISTVGRRVLHLDDSVGEFFAPYANSPAVQAVGVFSKLGDQPELRLIASALIVLGTFAGGHRLVRAGARMIIAHEAATLAKDLIKTDIDRTRPRSAKNRGEKKPKKGNHTAKEETSFPSGHSAGAIAAARAFSREFPEYCVGALGLAALLAASQIVRRAHYTSDVGAGIVLGLAAEALTNEVWNAAQMDERSTA